MLAEHRLLRILRGIKSTAAVVDIEVVGQLALTLMLGARPDPIKFGVSL